MLLKFTNICLGLILQLDLSHLLILQITGLAFSSTDPDYIYIQGVDYEVITSYINGTDVFFCLLINASASDEISLLFTLF